MRRLFGLAFTGGALWWWLGRRRRETGASAVIGYADGTSARLEEGSPELARLLEIARRVSAP